MDVEKAHDFQINESQFSEVHGDQNNHHHDHSVRVDGQNNTAVYHGEYRGTFDNRIINENCSNMVIYGQGQNCQVTLDAVDLPFLMNRNRNRNRQRRPQNPSSPLRNGNQFDVPAIEGQHDAGTAETSNANYHQNRNSITNNTGQMTVIGQGDNTQVHSSVNSLPPPQPPPPFQQSSESASQPSYQGVEVEPSFDDQYMRPENKPPSTTTLVIGSDSMTSSVVSDPSSAQATERNGTTGQPILRTVPGSPRSSAVSVASALPPVTTTTPSMFTAQAAEQTAANGIHESLPLSPGTPLSPQAAYVASSEEMQHDTQAHLQSDVVSIPTEPANPITATARAVLPSPGQVSPSPGVPRTKTHQMPQQNTTGSDASIPKPASKMDPPTTSGISALNMAAAAEKSPSKDGPLTDAPPEIEDTSQRILSDTATPKSNKRKKNILWILEQRFFRLFKGWKIGKEKTPGV